LYTGIFSHAVISPSCILTFLIAFEFDKFISEILDRAASDNFKAIISTSAIHQNVGCGFEKNQGLTLGQLAKNGILLLLNSLNEIFPHPSL
jgi:hypothetical protein